MTEKKRGGTRIASEGKKLGRPKDHTKTVVVSVRVKEEAESEAKIEIKKLISKKGYGIRKTKAN